ncbi:hypothetical protein RYH80_17910 [Halobaculum sp. MBLA0147]|uniref:hypothetical protein n=1 Tax=Halobaculum sp. MBLA0147 TaxID=3079934 RepID=UPI0035240796
MLLPLVVILVLGLLAGVTIAVASAIRHQRSRTSTGGPDVPWETYGRVSPADRTGSHIEGIPRYPEKMPADWKERFTYYPEGYQTGPAVKCTACGETGNGWPELYDHTRAVCPGVPTEE